MINNRIFPFDMLPGNNFFRPVQKYGLRRYSQELETTSYVPIRPNPPVDPIDICSTVEISTDVETVHFERLDTLFIVELINNLHLSNLSIYKQSKMMKDVEHIFYIKKRACIERHYLIIEIARKNINFIDVTYDGVLLQQTYIENVFPCFPIVFKSNISIYFRGQLYQTVYNVPFLNPLEKIKESIISLFTFPSKTFMLFGKLLLHFTLINGRMNLTFMGSFEKNSFYAITHWDWCQGTLVGKYKNEIQYIWNDRFFRNTNQFPSIEEQSLVLIGGLYNYQLDGRDRSIIQVTYGGLSSFFLDELEGGQISYVSLKRNIEIKESKSKYILSFSNVKHNPVYALIGHASFVNSVRTILTFPIRVCFTEYKNDEFQREETFCFKLCSTKLLIYSKSGFFSYLEKHRGNIELSDLYLTNLNQKKEYSEEMNQLVPSQKIC